MAVATSSVSDLLLVAHEQATAVRQTVVDWWRAKREGQHEPGVIYGRRLVMALWELNETVERIQKELPTEARITVGRLLRAFWAAVGRVDRDGLWFAARATWHRADATVGGRTADYFGGPPVTSSTASVERAASRGWTGISPESDEWHAAYVVKDVTITLAGKNSEKRVVIAGDAAHEAASQLVDELDHELGKLAG